MLELTLLEQTENECDQIILKNGDVIKAIIQKTRMNYIKYQPCDSLNTSYNNYNTEYILDTRKHVFAIYYKDGKKVFFTKSTNIEEPNQELAIENRQQRGQGSFLSGFFGFIISASVIPASSESINLVIILGSLGVILSLIEFLSGITTLKEIRGNPELKGKGYAITGFFFGGIIVLIIAFFILAIIF